MNKKINSYILHFLYLTLDFFIYYYTILETDLLVNFFHNGKMF